MTDKTLQRLEGAAHILAIAIDHQRRTSEATATADQRRNRREQVASAIGQVLHLIGEASVYVAMEAIGRAAEVEA